MKGAWILCALVMALASCSNGRLSAVAPPPKAKAVDLKPVREAFTRAGDQVVKARESKAKVEVQIDQADKATKDAAAIAQKAFVDGLEAGGKEAALLKQNVAVISAALAVARASLADVSTALLSAGNELETSKAALADVQAAASAKEQENKTLRSNLDDANVKIKSADKLADDLASQKTITRFWRWTTFAGFLVALLLGLGWRIWG